MFFNISNVFRKRAAAGSFRRSDYTTAMEYAAALENRFTQQEGRILDLEASLNGKTTLTLPTELAASAAVSTVATSTAATKITAMRAMIQSLAALVTALYTKIFSNGGSGVGKGCYGGGGGNGTNQTPGTHKCANSKK